MTPPDKLLPLLTAAAELRAAGASWPAVAAHVRRRADTVRRWPKLYPDVWAHLVAGAERQALADGGNEAVTALRQMVRSEDEKVRRDAAKVLVDLREAALRRTGDAGPADAWARLAEAFTDQQLRELTEELARSVAEPQLNVG
jgi:hypothetical protein